MGIADSRVDTGERWKAWSIANDAGLLESEVAIRSRNVPCDGEAIESSADFPGDWHSFEAVMSLGDRPVLAAHATFAFTAKRTARKQSVIPKTIRLADGNPRDLSARSLASVAMHALTGSLSTTARRPLFSVNCLR